MRNHVLSCLLPVIGVGLPAQTIHVVGPGGLPEISSALAVAAPGDVIHVQPGTYASFTVNIACTIRALAPGVVVAAPGYAVTLAPPPGQLVHVAGLEFAFSYSTPTGPSLAIPSGRVTLDGCVVSSTYSTPIVVSDADLHLQDCTVTSLNGFGFFPGLQATNARVTAVDSEFVGSPPFTGIYNSPGIDATNTILHASGCTIRAGSNTMFAGPGLRANGGHVWLSDCTVQGHQYCAIEATTVLADRCVLLPALSTCSTPPTGGLLGVSRSQPLQNGAPFSLTYKTIPNSYAAVFASQELTTLMIPGLHAQTQWLGGAGVINLGVVLADPSGQATATWNIPAGAWLVDQPLWFQGLTGFALPLQLSPVAGGLIR